MLNCAIAAEIVNYSNPLSDIFIFILKYHIYYYINYDYNYHNYNIIITKLCKLKIDLQG